MNCSNCGEPLGPGRRYCRACGTFQTAPAAAGADLPVYTDTDTDTAQAESLPLALPLAPPPAPARRGVVRMLGLAISALVIGGVAYVAFAAVQSGDGAGSPEAAVRALADRLADEDVLGAIGTLAPDEVRSFDEAYKTGVERATEEDFVQDENPLQGVDIRIDGLELETQQLGDDVARVRLRGGTFGVTVDPARLAPKLREMAEESGEDISVDEAVTFSRLEKMLDEAQADQRHRVESVYLMTVKRDGGWYVSPFYTIAQVATELSGQPTPDFSIAHPAKGSASPEAALTDMVNDIGRLEVESAIDRLPPGELEVLKDYRDVIFTPDVRANLAEARESFSLEITDIDTTTTDVGDGRTRVDVNRVTGALEIVESDYSCGAFRSFGSVAELSEPGGFREFEESGDSIQFEDPCVESTSTTSGTFDITGTCITLTTTFVERDENGTVVDDGDNSNSECLDETAAGRLRDITGLDGIAVIVRELDGQWYLSPTDTIFYLADLVSENDGALDELIDEMTSTGSS